MSRGWILTWLPVLVLTSGCQSILHRFEPNCHAPQEYQRARQVEPLKVPAGLDTPNVQSALVIPDVPVAAPPRGANEACLDAPPRYKAPAAPKPASG
jgi:uncharacterized lipoprotein